MLIKTGLTPETAHEKSLAPKVVIIVIIDGKMAEIKFARLRFRYGSAQPFRALT